MAYIPFINPAERHEDLGVNAFSAGNGIEAQDVISEYDIYAPNALITLFERHNLDPGFRILLKAMGFSRGTAAPTVGHYEAPWRKDNVKIGAIVTASTGPGSDVTVSLDAASMYDTGVVQGASTLKGSYPVEGQILKLRDGTKAFIKEKITTENPHRLVLRPVLQTQDLVSSVVVGESYFLSDNAHADGSGLPKGRTPRVIRYTNTFQICKHSCGATGSSLTNETYFEPVAGMKGSMFLRTSMIAKQEFEDQCGGVLYWGTQMDNISVYSEGLEREAAVTGTEGLDRFAEVNAAKELYNVGAYDMSEFDAVGNYFEDEKVGIDRLIYWQGRSIFLETENLLVDFFNHDKSDMLVAGTLGFSLGDDPDNGGQYEQGDNFSAKVGFNAVKKGGFYHFLKKFNLYNDTRGAGQTGYDYKQRNLILPLGMTKDKGTNTNRGTIGYEYKALNGYSREVVIGDYSGVGVAGAGGMKPMPVNGLDITKTGFVSEVAFHGTCANHILEQNPA